MWADQCASVIYRHGGVGGKVGNGGDLYPLLFHERGIERATKKFQSAPGVGQVRIKCVESFNLSLMTPLSNVNCWFCLSLQKHIQDIV